MKHIMQLVAVFTVLGLLWTLVRTYMVEDIPQDPNDREEIEWP